LTRTYLLLRFYAIRVFKLSERNWWLTALVVRPCTHILLSIILTSPTQASLIIPSFALQTVYCVKMAAYKSILELSQIAIIAQVINAINAACDIAIAVAMVMLLHRSKTGLKQTDTIVNRLVLFVVNTGLLTSLCATTALVLLLASPNTLLYAIFFFITPRLYANSLFATLNARASIRANASDRDVIDAFSFSFVPATGARPERSGIAVVGVPCVLFVF
jgi:hypothetical protein